MEASCRRWHPVPRRWHTWVMLVGLAWRPGMSEELSPWCPSKELRPWRKRLVTLLLVVCRGRQALGGTVEISSITEAELQSGFPLSATEVWLNLWRAGGCACYARLHGRSQGVQCGDERGKCWKAPAEDGRKVVGQTSFCEHLSGVQWWFHCLKDSHQNLLKLRFVGC